MYVIVWSCTCDRSTNTGLSVCDKMLIFDIKIHKPLISQKISGWFEYLGPTALVSLEYTVFIKAWNHNLYKVKWLVKKSQLFTKIPQWFYVIHSNMCSFATFITTDSNLRLLHPLCDLNKEDPTSCYSKFVGPSDPIKAKLCVRFSIYLITRTLRTAEVELRNEGDCGSHSLL